jgi:hypothetical protein
MGGVTQATSSPKNPGRFNNDHTAKGDDRKLCEKRLQTFQKKRPARRR